VLALLHPDDVLTAVSALMGNAAAPADGLLDQDDADTAGEYRVLHADGHWVAVEAVGNNFLGNPDIGGLLLVARDVSDRRLFDDVVRALAIETVEPESLATLVRLLDDRMPGTTSALLVWEAPPLRVTVGAPAGVLEGEGPTTTVRCSAGGRPSGGWSTWRAWPSCVAAPSSRCAGRRPTTASPGC
jgi:hypothetical protein